ncbi:response regulator transcription factor [Limibacter armeniacum]|uniref:response regulator transcription factor n=1 Tax=Limibacter armeniacum TaxID=466084 RepID=UPI002FE5BE8E
MDKVLIIEDDHDISELLSIHLKDLGFDTDRVFDGKEGLVKALNETYRIIVLDIRLPGMDGFEICRQIRMEKIDTPIIMLTAKSEEIDKVLGLEIGADDYITKPFSIREFIARVKVISRRDFYASKPATTEKEEEEINLPNLSINLPKRIVKVYNEQVELSPKEFDLLVLLASNPGRTYTRIQLLNMVWGVEFEGFEHTVNSHINRLRSKIEKDMHAPEFILTTWGVGYKFKDID